ncbi:MAG: hypothetical protein ACTSX0_05785 [Promethearchaeota archaeon]
MSVDKNLKEILKESVREVIKEERMTLYEIMIPYVSDKELNEIHKKYGSPSDYDEGDFVDMTEWIRNEN